MNTLERPEVAEFPAPTGPGADHQLARPARPPARP